VAEAVDRAVRRPLAGLAESARLSASVGIALFPDHAASGERLLRTADAAMYDAKAAGAGLGAVGGRTPACGPPSRAPPRAAAARPS
jgi:GGDEF domain-containing protein